MFFKNIVANICFERSETRGEKIDFLIFGEDCLIEEGGGEELCLLWRMVGKSLQKKFGRNNCAGIK